METGAGSVSVVIPVRNVAATIEDQLASLAAQDCDGPYEVVVADNGCTDGTLDRVRKWHRALPDLRVVDARGPRGCSHPRNVGTRAAAGRLILLCDGDDIVCRGWIRSLVTGLQDHDIVTGPLAMSTLNLLWQHSFGNAHPDMTTELPVAYGHLPYPSGGNMGIRREVFDALGGFNTRLKGGEDIDLGWRALRAGFSLGFAPGAVLHHRMPANMRKAARTRLRRGFQLPLLYRLHREFGMPRESRAEVIADYKNLIRRAPFVLMGRGGPYEWTYATFGRLGRLLGSIRHRSIYL